MEHQLNTVSKKFVFITTFISAMAAASVVAKPEHGQQFTDWTAKCEVNESGEERCHISQLFVCETSATQNQQDQAQQRCQIAPTLTPKENERPMLHFSAGYVEDKPIAFVHLPLGVSLPGGAGLQVDEGEVSKMAYQRCDANGCMAPIELSNQLLAAMKAGNKARIFFFDAVGKQGAFPVSLLGFTAGFNSLR